jgi:hypothetical protein
VCNAPDAAQRLLDGLRAGSLDASLAERMRGPRAVEPRHLPDYRTALADVEREREGGVLA